jgi:hypothetical protein
MTNAADALATNLAEAIARADAPAELAPQVQPLPEEHPGPWTCQEELGGPQIPADFQEGLDVHTDDARRRHVVRDARGGIVVQCVKFSRSDEEKLARFIASIPTRMAEIERLEAVVAKLTNANRRIPELETECGRLRTLVGELCEVLQKTSPGPRTSGGDVRLTVAAKLLIEADINFSDLVLVLAHTLLDATTDGATRSPAATTRKEQPVPWSRRQAPQVDPSTWAYKEEPDFEGGAS